MSQDNLRRVVLRGTTSRQRRRSSHRADLPYAISHGFHTVLEGILTARITVMLAGLRDDYGDRSLWWFLDVPFEETLTRAHHEAAGFHYAQGRTGAVVA